MNNDSLFGNLFISAGAMKAGTTWLYAVLQRHPELHFTNEKEIHYFHAKYVNSEILSDQRRLELTKTRYLTNFDPKKANIDRIRLNLHWVAAYLNRPVDDFWYRNLFTYPRGERYGCDFSNLYALLPQKAWPQIEANCQQLKVLYTLRHPIKRLWSHTKFHLQVTNQLDKLDSWSPKKFKAFVRQPFIWDNAEYGVALRKMKSGLSDTALKVIFFEDIRQSPRQLLHDIEDFLDISHIEYPDNLLNSQVNKSVSRQMPEFFLALFKDDVARICQELEAEGLTLPQSWET